MVFRKWVSLFCKEAIVIVKGISRQVIVLHTPDQKLFEQAIFILKDDALKDGGVTDDVLLKEARRLLGERKSEKKRPLLYGPVWACVGAVVTASIWGLTMLF